MIIPRYETLIGQLFDESPLIGCALGPSSPCGNPRRYKFYWRIFSLEPRYEGNAFMRRAPRLCSSRYYEESTRLKSAHVPALVYGLKLPRRDLANPFDLKHPKWQGARFAPAWNLDNDPIVAGGHR